MTKTQEILAEIQLGVQLLLQRLPQTEGSIIARLNLVKAYASNFPVEMAPLFGELSAVAKEILENGKIGDLHPKAAHLLDLRLRLIFTQLHQDIETHLRDLYEHLGSIAFEIPLQQEHITKMRQAIASLQHQLHQGVSTKSDENNFMGLLLYLSQEMRLIFSAIPSQKERLWKPLAHKWNNILFLSARYVKFTGHKTVSEEAKLPSGGSVSFLVASQ